MKRTERAQKIADFELAVSNSYWIDQDRGVLAEVLARLRDDSAPLPFTPIVNFYAFNSIFNLLERPQYWDEFDHRVIELVTLPRYWQPTPKGSHYRYDSFRWGFFDWLSDQVRVETHRTTTQLAADALEKHGITPQEMLREVFEHMAGLFLDDQQAATSAGRFVLSRLPDHYSFILTCLEGNRDCLLVELLLHHHEDFLRNHLADLPPLKDDQTGTGNRTISVPAVKRLLQKDARYYEPFVLSTIPEVTSPQGRFGLRRLLVDFLPEQYQSGFAEYAYEYLEGVRQIMVKQGDQFREDTRWDPEKREHVSLLNEQIDYILGREGTRAREYIHQLLKDCHQINIRVLETVVRHLGQDGLDLLMEGLRMDILKMPYEGSTYYRRFFSLLSGLDYSTYHPQVWALTKHKSKPMREMAAVALSKLGTAAIPGARALLEAKTGDQRQAGALILSLIPGDESKEILLNALDQEKNDDARDLMLESLQGILPAADTEAAIGEKVQAARQRGKLDKPLEPWLDESKLPALHWAASGEVLNGLTVRFLLYRQSRPKDIRTDWEAKPLLEGLDRARSADFANAILKAYLKNGADAKGKYLLTLAGRLGNDQTIDVLKARVTQWADASRGKMAENAVRAIALAGTNKALRAVEFFSRKYKSKNKNIGEAANQAFAIAAEELGIPPSELADSIIPDFGFGGLFREFSVNGQPYRAFVDNNFKLAFLNEDGKALKSLPKGTEKELAEEFKEIGKEIRDIVKSQSGRLEQYLVTQHKWPVERWQAFFMGNPVVFAYAVRLIWGVYDGDNELQFTFRCLEDQTLVNREGDETELPEGVQIGMVHPMAISAEEVAFWNEHLADSDVEPIFPQLNRPVVTLEEADQAKKISYAFRNVKIGGYHFVGRMDKLGWHRGSVVDGGMISSYYKNFADLNVAAFLNTEGIGVGYYDEHAVLLELYFVQPDRVRTGSYTYDEPSNENDPRLIPFGQVSPIVYSEIMGDLGEFIPKAEPPLEV